MTNDRTDTFEDLLQELHKDPGFRAEYERQRPYYDIIREIIDCRKLGGITQKELAERAGMQQSTISRIESGESNVRLSTLIRIAEALNTSLDIRFVPKALDEADFEKLLPVSVTTELVPQTYRKTPSRTYATKPMRLKA